MTCFPIRAVFDKYSDQNGSAKNTAYGFDIDVIFQTFLTICVCS